MRFAGTIPVQLALDAAKMVRLSKPKMMEIWSLIAMSKETHQPSMLLSSQVEKYLLELMERGEITAQSTIRLPQFYD
jgi:hypothetical protein